jgi:hypothetical protein
MQTESWTCSKAHIELAITTGHGFVKVGGIVLQDKKPVAGAMVLLAPQDRNHGKILGAIKAIAVEHSQCRMWHQVGIVSGD